jgi:putative endonuclease
VSDRAYFVYIMASDAGCLYVGMTNNLARRVAEHRAEGVQTFAKRYAIRHLVYYDVTRDVHSAIAREKQIKGWRREKKIALIESMNPELRDLADELFSD